MSTLEMPARLEDLNNSAESEALTNADNTEFSAFDVQDEAFDESIAIPHINTTEFEEKLAKYRTEYDIRTPTEEFDLRSMVLEGLTLDRCFLEECRRAQAIAARATYAWDEDREAEAEAVAQKLSRNPGRWRAELLRSRHGCEYLVREWKGLLDKLKENGSWDDRQTSKALDLLGLSQMLREGRTPITPPEGAPEGWLADTIQREIEWIENHIQRKMITLDEYERTAAEAGHTISSDPIVIAIRRRQAGAFRRFMMLRERLAPLRRDRRDVPAAAPARKRTESASIKNPTYLERSKPHETEQRSAPEPAPAAAKSNPRPEPIQFDLSRGERKQAASLLRKLDKAAKRMHVRQL